MLRHCTFIALLLCGPIQLLAQRDSLAHEHAQHITPLMLHRLVHVLASDSLEGRATGELGQKRAANFIRSEFSKAGLVSPEGAENMFLPYMLHRASPTEVDLSIGKVTLQNQRDFFTMNNINGLNISNSSLVICPGEIKKISDMVKGAVVLTVPVNGQADSPEEMARALRDAGADGLIYVSPNFSKDISKLKHKLSSNQLALVNKWDTQRNQFPFVSISEQAAERIWKERGLSHKILNRKLAVGPWREDIGYQWSMRQKRDTVWSENLAGMLVGSEVPDEVVVITAHYDHLGREGDTIYYGADDDGSGTATLMALAHALNEASKNGIKPKRSIMLLAFSGEEKGLLGSDYYTSHPIVPLSKTVANLNIDMIGRWDKAHERNQDSMFVYVIGSDRISKALKETDEKTAQRWSKLKLDYTFNAENDPNRFYYRSDHYNFAKRGVPVVFYFTGVHDDYHKPTDTPDKVMYGKMAHIARHIFMTAWQLADMPDRILPDKK